MKPIYHFALFFVFWTLFYLIFLWYFQAAGCAYYADFWLAYGDSIRSPWWGFFLTFVLFWLHSLMMLFIGKKRSKSTVLLLLLTCIASSTSLYGLYEFKQFMLFQKSGESISSYVDIQSLSEREKRYYQINRQNRERREDAWISSPYYCAAIDFYRR